MEVNVISPEERAKVEGKSYLRSRLAGPTTTFFMPVERFQFRQGIKEQSSYAGRRRLTAKLRSKIEPEQSLGKISMDATSNFNFGFARATVPLMFESSLFIQTDGSIMMR
jgi:hypothetical protein